MPIPDYMHTRLRACTRLHAYQASCILGYVHVPGYMHIYQACTSCHESIDASQLHWGTGMCDSCYEGYLLLTTRYSLHTTHYLLHTTHYLLLTTHYSLLTTYYSLLTPHYSLHTTHHLLLLPLTSYFLLTTGATAVTRASGSSAACASRRWSWASCAGAR